MKRIYLAALLMGVANLPGCVLLSQVGAGVAGAKAEYDIVGEITSVSSAALTAACKEWEDTRTTIKTKRATDTAPWLDATCNAPPPPDPIAAAIWVAGLSGRIKELEMKTPP